MYIHHRTLEQCRCLSLPSISNCSLQDFRLSSSVACSWRKFEPCSVGVSECRAVSGQCRASVGPVSGQCRGSVGAVSVDTGVGVSSSVGAVSEQCRPVSGILDSGPPWLLSRSVGVSECRSVGVSGGVEVSECRSVETLRVAHHETHLRERSLSDW